MAGRRRLRASSCFSNLPGEPRETQTESSVGAQRGGKDTDTAGVRSIGAAAAGDDRLCSGTHTQVAAATEKSLLQTFPAARQIGEVQAANEDPRR